MSLLISIYIFLLISLIIFKLLKNSDLKNNIYFLLFGINTIFSLSIYFIIEYQNYFINNKFILVSYLLLLFFQTNIIFLYFLLKYSFFNIQFLSISDLIKKYNVFDSFLIPLIIIITYIGYYYYTLNNSTLCFYLFILSIISVIITIFISALMFLFITLIDCFYINKIIKASLFKEIENFISKENFNFLKKLDLFIENDNPLIIKNKQIAIKLNIEIEEKFYKLLDDFLDNNIFHRKFFHFLKTKKEFNIKIISIDIGLNNNETIKFNQIDKFLNLNDDSLELNFDNICSLLKMDTY